ncbi:hypothetical protein ZHAS_00017782 [Anopheles sinensis]|uniref:Uncharacterized protein n=1 Tax=Anopheles sinensis TaxID=74873 RepID=A0A084WHG9_ANOSI|nr:hypothetical protein ZHAS_00017782 [Anopheles sinensis]
MARVAMNHIVFEVKGRISIEDHARNQLERDRCLERTSSRSVARSIPRSSLESMLVLFTTLPRVIGVQEMTFGLGVATDNGGMQRLGFLVVESFNVVAISSEWAWGYLSYAFRRFKINESASG